MAAPGARMASRPFCKFITNVGRTRLTKTCFRKISFNYPARVALHTQNTVGNVASASPWKLMGAVCLQRLPVTSQKKNPIEDQFAELMQQLELERSMISRHELRLHEEAERLSRKQADDYDSDEEANYGAEEIVTAQDLEDSWEQKLKGFEPTPRDTAGGEEDPRSMSGYLADSLVLLVEQTVGSDKLWLLPQLQWESGETLRHTAERALASLPECNFKATFLGNTPCGVYKYKLPKVAQTESNVGTKVFFFKAILSDGSLASATKGPFMWVKKSELQDYLKPAYFEKVDRFIIGV
ncbi:39S ribosomal protein L46, mitochondrial [Osmerus eperlanus]|uniref:39S ribosomal protein L46, mitochondrial n=1 Tax=Osmerus eperlanus TaxID=29151 RepID=UPI002E0F34B6